MEKGKFPKGTTYHVTEAVGDLKTLEEHAELGAILKKIMNNKDNLEELTIEIQRCDYSFDHQDLINWHCEQLKKELKELSKTVHEVSKTLSDKIIERMHEIRRKLKQLDKG
jgi:predicted RNase H-like nuclease (RuvC/YqgF family)